MMKSQSTIPTQKTNKKGCLVASLVGGFATLLGICVLAIVIFFVFDPFGEEISSWLPEVPSESESQSYVNGDEDYTLQRIGSAETTPESVEGIGGDTPTSLTLSDRTQLDLPAMAGEITVRLSRESTTIHLNQPGFETSGSTRVVAFELDQLNTDFIPRLTIPAQEMGELDSATVNIVRVGPLWVDGEILPDQITFLPLTLDSNGDIVIIDTDIASLVAAGMTFNQSAGVKMAALAPQYGDGRFLTVKYVPMTFQGNLDWYAFPRLVRMIPDAKSPGNRRPADLSRDQAVLEKPVTNVVTLLHGHNEQEKDGRAPTTADAPWNFAYKQEVWNEFYKTFLETQADLVDCTAFYEFIYPSFRSAYSPIEGNPVEPLGDTFAKAMRVGARNDGYQIKRMREADMPVNVYIAAHSMGGLVARAGVRQFDEYMQDSFRRLVTWGTPHHGSPLVTLGYLFRGDYVVNPGQLRAAHWFPSNLPEGNVDILLGSGMLKWILDRKVQLDTPGSRDLRWDNERPLRLDEIFSDDTKALNLKDAAGTQYNLVNGTWLYNDNLRRFNDSDPYYNTDKYVFLYGITSKHLPDESGETATGATILPTLLKDSQRTISDSGVERAEGESDGAVPLFSMAGMRITTNRVYIGDLDHEEYYSSTSGKGRITAQATFYGFGLDKPRCACARVVIQNPESDNEEDCTPGLRTINASLILDSTFAPYPGNGIQSAEAIVYPQGYPDDFETLGDLNVKQTGEMTATFDVPETGDEQILLIVRVYLRDGTKLDSEPVVFNKAPCLPQPSEATEASSQETAENEYAWRLVEIIDYENADRWAEGDAHPSYAISHSYSRGVYSASDTYEGDDPYDQGLSGTLGLQAVFTGVPEIIYPDQPVSLNFSFTVTENTVVKLAFGGSAGADFDQWDVGPDGVTRGSQSFTTKDGINSFTLSTASDSPLSYNETLTAMLGPGEEGDRIALRTKFYMGVPMGTNYVYEWKK